MERSEKIRDILQFVMDHPESSASVAVGRRTIGIGGNLRNGNNISELNAVLSKADDEEIEACFYIIS